MTPDHVRLRSYFSPPGKSYWKWQDKGHVAVWNDERTIAFREELEVVLSALAPIGLPPLGSILLFLAACRDSWEEQPNRRTLLHTHLGLLYGGSYAELLTATLTGLGQLHAQRDLFRSSPSAKAALAAIVFEGAWGRYPPDESELLAKRFSLHLAEDDFDWKPQSALDDFLYDLGCLHRGLSHTHFEALALRLQTGLDSLPQPAPVEPPPPASARHLIATLQDDPELGPVARLAQLVLAAVQLPRALSDPDDLPLGGVSDITNRGPLDRLLLSELAHDDMTLAVRVALNEALYLRRESPPRTPPRRRRLLLDTGLRTWGVPRVFISAIGLAMAAKAESDQPVDAFAAAGCEAVPADLTSASGLQSHLSRLESYLHPAGAVQWLAESSASTADEEGELVVITTEDTVNDADFQREIGPLGQHGLMLATVSRDGQFHLQQRGLHSTQTICRAKFDLDEVLNRRPKEQKLHDERRDEQLPAFFHASAPPLRFSCPIDLNRSWFVHPESVISLTRDGRLLLWEHPDRGARQIACGERRDASLFWCNSTWDGDRLRLVAGKRSQHGMQAIIYDRRTQKVQTAKLALSDNNPDDVLGVPGAVLVIYPDSVDALDWADGKRLSHRHGLRFPQRQGRYVAYGVKDTGATEWRAISYRPGPTEHSIYEEYVCREPSVADKLLAILDPIGLEQTIGFTAAGALRSMDGLPTVLKQPRPGAVQPPYSLGSVSRDGQRVSVSGRWPSKRLSQVVIDVISGETTGVPCTGAQAVLERPLFALAKPRVVHTRFTKIGLNAKRQLVLLSQRGTHWPICFERMHRHIRFPAKPTSAAQEGPLQSAAAFENVDSFSEGFSLHVARWPDGSRAWLDGRGLLHLRSSDPSVAEVSLVLTQGPFAGWISTGQVFGPPYWLDTHSPTISAREVWDQVLIPFAGRLT